MATFCMPLPSDDCQPNPRRRRPSVWRRAVDHLIVRTITPRDSIMAASLSLCGVAKAGLARPEVRVSVIPDPMQACIIHRGMQLGEGPWVPRAARCWIINYNCTDFPGNHRSRKPMQNSSCCKRFLISYCKQIWICSWKTTISL
jgi:hypothetical protein